MSMDFSPISAYLQGKSEKKAAQINAKSTQDANTQNALLSLFTRGAALSGDWVPEELQGASAAILPYYLAGAEKEIGGDAASLYRAIRDRAGGPDIQLADYSALLGGYGRAMADNSLLAEDLASGRVTRDMISESAPVFSARVGVANAKRDAGLEALQQTLNEIDAIQAGKGYSGDSTGNRMLRFNARRSIGSEAATDLANVNLQNEIDRRQIMASGRDLRLANIDLPSSLARSAVALKQMPETAVTQSYQNSISPFGFFNLGPHQFPTWQANPEVKPTTGFGQALSQAASNTVNAGNDYALSALQRAQANNWGRKSRTTTGAADSFNYSGAGYNGFDASGNYSGGGQFYDVSPAAYQGFA